jgi:hypothetical protein
MSSWRSATGLALKSEDLLGVAKQYGIPVYCDWKQRPVLPRIVFIDANNPYFDPTLKKRNTDAANEFYTSGGVFSMASFDFIISLLVRLAELLFSALTLFRRWYAVFEPPAACLIDANLRVIASIPSRVLSSAHQIHRTHPNTLTRTGPQRPSTTSICRALLACSQRAAWPICTWATPCSARNCMSKLGRKVSRVFADSCAQYT